MMLWIGSVELNWEYSENSDQIKLSPPAGTDRKRSYKIVLLWLHDLVNEMKKNTFAFRQHDPRARRLPYYSADFQDYYALPSVIWISHSEYPVDLPLQSAIDEAPAAGTSAKSKAKSKANNSKEAKRHGQQPRGRG